MSMKVLPEDFNREISMTDDVAEAVWRKLHPGPVETAPAAVPPTTVKSEHTFDPSRSPAYELQQDHIARSVYQHKLRALHEARAAAKGCRRRSRQS